MLITFPLMAAIQVIAARIGRTTGHGISGNLCRHYPNWLLYGVVFLLFAANAINIGADLSAMGEAVRLLIGGPVALYVVVFGVASVLAIVFLNYKIYVRVLKWLTLSLFAYVAALFASNVPWGEAIMGIVIPTVTWEPRVLHDAARDPRDDNLALPVLLAGRRRGRGGAHQPDAPAA